MDGVQLFLRGPPWFSGDLEALGTWCRCRYQGQNRERYSSAPSILGAYIKASSSSKRHLFLEESAVFRSQAESWSLSRGHSHPEKSGVVRGAAVSAGTPLPDSCPGEARAQSLISTPTPERFRVTFLRFQDQRSRLRGFLSPQTRRRTGKPNSPLLGRTLISRFGEREY